MAGNRLSNLFESLAQSWRALSQGSDSGLVPQTRLAGPMPWVIAIMVALPVIAAAAGLALSNTARSASAELAGGITVQVIEANPVLRRQQAEAAVRILRATPGVIEAAMVAPDEVERLIEPWLGTRAAGDEDIPVPALVDARLRDPINGEVLGQLRRTVREVAPAARVDAQSTWLTPVFDAIVSLQLLALAMVALLAVSTAAAVLLAVRNALGANRDTIEIFQRSIGFDAAGGGAVGLALGLVAVLFLGRQMGELGAGLVSGGALGWLDWVLLALVPVAGILLATITARLTVMRTLKRML
jgi:cell division transport system permease protein